MVPDSAMFKSQRITVDACVKFVGGLHLGNDCWQLWQRRDIQRLKPHLPARTHPARLLVWKLHKWCVMKVGHC